MEVRNLNFKFKYCLTQIKKGFDFKHFNQASASKKLYYRENPTATQSPPRFLP